MIVNMNGEIVFDSDEMEDALSPTAGAQPRAHAIHELERLARP